MLFENELKTDFALGRFWPARRIALCLCEIPKETVLARSIVKGMLNLFGPKEALNVDEVSEMDPEEVDGEDRIVIKPMMYLALSYDHRIVDGKEAVTFLVRVKENLEDPQRMLFDL